ncbi:MAG TPA: ferredoxin [Stellaceae bacterium]|jgi:ferredoxin|nr:ferredoxin [Stellaceae bacterium]
MVASLEQAVAMAAGVAIALRGAFHPEASDGVPLLPGGTPAGTLVLAGFVGRAQWPVFAASPEASDGRPNPLDRWSRRVIDGIAAAIGAHAIYPFEGPPWLPFQRWAMKAEPVHRSALGMLIHRDWGLWHSYRGALAFAERVALPERVESPSPCDSCAAKPCLTACPVGAFTLERYDVEACAGHLRSSAGTDCLELGCRAREACPVGAAHRFGRDQAGFHMRAFLASRKAASDV